MESTGNCPVRQNNESLLCVTEMVQTCDTEHDTPQGLPAAPLVAQEKGEPVVGPEGFEDGGPVHDDVVQTHDCVEHEPDHDDRREERAHKLGAELLDQEERRQDHNGNDHDDGCTAHMMVRCMSRAENNRCMFAVLSKSQLHLTKAKKSGMHRSYSAQHVQGSINGGSRGIPFGAVERAVAAIGTRLILGFHLMINHVKPPSVPRTDSVC